MTTDAARQRASSGRPWETANGYSRAVRVGPFVAVAGTVAADAEGKPMHPGDAHAQTLAAIERIASDLAQVGGSLADIVRTRAFITRIEDADAVGRAHGEVMGSIRPALTLLQVAGLIAPEFLVEIEADAIVGSLCSCASNQG